MQQLRSSFWIRSLRSEEFCGVLTWVTPSALFRVGATSRSLCETLSTEAARSYCNFVCSLKPEDWVYIDDLTAVGYNHQYAQVLGPQGSSDSKAKRYGCAVYGVLGNKVQDRLVHQQMYRIVSLPVRNLFKVQATIAAVRIHADGEFVPEDAVRIEGLWGESSLCANVLVPAGLSGCIKKAQLIPTMKDTSTPLVLQDVEMLNSRRTQDRRCILASHLKMPARYLDWDGGDFDKYWMDFAGPHQIFRADGSHFRVQDMIFVNAFLTFFASKTTDVFSEAIVPLLFKEFEAKYPDVQVETMSGSRLDLSNISESVEEDPDNRVEFQPHENPVHIDEEVAAATVEVEWTEQVEDHIRLDFAAQSKAGSDQSYQQAANHGTFAEEKVNILRIGSPQLPGESLEEFRQILLHGKHLGMCRSALEENGLQFVLPHGALMVVTPEQHTTVRHALKDMELHPFHLIVAEQFDYLIEEVLAEFPCKRRPRVKAGVGGRQELCVFTPSPKMKLEEDSSAQESSSDQMKALGEHLKTKAEQSRSPKPSDQYPDFTVSRTFLCEVPVMKSATSASYQSAP